MSRAQQLESAVLDRANAALPAGAAALQGGALLNRCLVSDIPDAAALMKAVTVQLPSSLEQHRMPWHRGGSKGAGESLGTPSLGANSAQNAPNAPARCSSIRLVVLDSIASVLRAEFDTTGRQDSFARAQYMYDLSSALKKLVHLYGIAVLVMNQVTASSVDLGNVGNTTPLADQMRACGCGGGAGAAAAAVAATTSTAAADCLLQGSCTKAALGAVWSHCISARVMLTRSPPPSAQPPLSVPVTLPQPAVRAALCSFQKQAQAAKIREYYIAVAQVSSSAGASQGASEGGECTTGGARKRLRELDRDSPGAAAAPWLNDSVSLAAGAALDPEALFDCGTVDKGALRWAHVQFSPWSPNNGALYTVTATGVHGVVLVQQ